MQCRQAIIGALPVIAETSWALIFTSTGLCSARLVRRLNFANCRGSADWDEFILASKKHCVHFAQRR